MSHKNRNTTTEILNTLLIKRDFEYMQRPLIPTQDISTGQEWTVATNRKRGESGCVNYGSYVGVQK